jgi:hypothetical protein
MMKIKQLISNICEDEESNNPFALMGYKWFDISIVGFLLTSYHSLKFRLMFRDKYFTHFLWITWSYAQIRHWNNLLYITVMLFVCFLIYLFLCIFIFLFYFYVLILFMLLISIFIIIFYFFIIFNFPCFMFYSHTCTLYILLTPVHINPVTATHWMLLSSTYNFFAFHS